MQLVTNINIDLSNPGITPRIHGKQDDSNSRYVAISLYDNGAAWEVPGDAVLMMRYQGPTGAKGAYTATPSGDTAFAVYGNTVQCALVDQMFAAAGRVKTELRIVDSQSSVSTWEFYIDVEGSKSGDATLPSDYYNLLTDIAAAVAADADRAEEAANSVDPSLLLHYEDYDPTGDVKAAGGIVDYVSNSALTPNAQSFTDEQKAQIRENIGAAQAGTNRVYEAAGTLMSGYSYAAGNVVIANYEVYNVSSNIEVNLNLSRPPAYTKTIAASAFNQASAARCSVDLVAGTKSAVCNIQKDASDASTVYVTFVYLSQ